MLEKNNILQIKDLSVSFGGLIANNNLNMDLQEGEIHALIGPNGSGKSTCLNTITGIYEPDSGEIIFADENITGLKPHLIARKGISRTFQNIQLYKKLTVIENVMVGNFINTKCNLFSVLLATRNASSEEKEIYNNSLGLIEIFNLLPFKDKEISEVPPPQQRMIEICRALATQPKVLLLDEPAAGLNKVECQTLNKCISKIREMGISIILIEHNMEVALEVADRVTVIDFGEQIAEGDPASIRKNPKVIEAYLGKEYEKDGGSL